MSAEVPKAVVVLKAPKAEEEGWGKEEGADAPKAEVVVGVGTPKAEVEVEGAPNADDVAGGAVDEDPYPANPPPPPTPNADVVDAAGAAAI